MGATVALTTTNARCCGEATVQQPGAETADGMIHHVKLTAQTSLATATVIPGKSHITIARRHNSSWDDSSQFNVAWQKPQPYPDIQIKPQHYSLTAAGMTAHNSNTLGKSHNHIV
jgi:hypothetical protein